MDLSGTTRKPTIATGRDIGGLNVRANIWKRGQIYLLAPHFSKINLSPFCAITTYSNNKITTNTTTPYGKTNKQFI